jgi:bacteriocin biosynthesis cyclodehydratase domain-containing protein
MISSVASGWVLRTRSDLVAVSEAAGLRLFCGSSSLLIRGTSTGKWLLALLPFLDGSTPLSDLISGVDAERSAHIEKLLARLVATGMIRNAANDRHHELRSDQLTRFANVIAYVDALTDSPEARFEDFTKTPILALGDNDSVRAFVEAMAGMGNNLAKAGPTYDESDTGWVSRLDLEELQTAGIIVCFGPANCIGDLVVRMDTGQGKPKLIAAVHLGNDVWIGPYPGHEACWSCAWQRISDNLESADPENSEREIPPNPIEAQFVAAICAFECFCAITRCHPELLSEPSILRVNRHLLTTQRHRYRPSRSCAICRSGAITGSGTRRSRVRVNQQALIRGAWNLVDSRTGIFANLSEDGLKQLPMAVVQVTMGFSATTATGVSRVIAAGPDLPAAQTEAILQAASLQASASKTWLTQGDGWRLLTRGIRGNRKSQTMTSIWAVAAGQCYDEAVCRGLFDLAVHTFAATNSFETGASQELVVSSGSDLSDLLRLIELLGVVFSGYRIGSAIGLPIYGFTLNGVPLWITSHASPDQAVMEGMRMGLLASQLPESRASSGKLLRRPSFSVTPLERPSPGNWRAALHSARERLSAIGIDVGVKIYQDDSALTSLTPHIVGLRLGASGQFGE